MKLLWRKPSKTLRWNQLSFGKNPDTTNTTANTKGKVFPQWGGAISTLSLPSQIVGCLYANQLRRLHQVGKDFQRNRSSWAMGVKLAKPKSFDNISDWKVVHVTLLKWLKGCECLAF